ncbi:aldose 1-epimerase [Maribacter sp. ANRC-HE7]|uniref:Aldose 1-epimerase n=1 Tax=Maribacter aquimaris TaxID=2737171 RepID=A0ABR7V347_9FLAO|nr:aldose 1-epimerase [Maribacter aquimaris]MBD0778111.1 aldose 1-epimerase [Maribacter aquimaris]
MVDLKLGNQTVKIEKGELVSYNVDGYEYIHQKGSPGWRNADTEMFPIIGPTADAGFLVKTPKGNAVQDQHGLLRELEYVVADKSGDSVILVKEYKADAKVGNAKYPEKSTAAELFWPYDFTFTKSFQLKKDGLYITFAIEGENGMPFMLGYHPAFKLHGENVAIEAEGRSITIPEIIEVGSRAMEIPNCSSIVLKDQRTLTITTEGYGNFMLWTEVDNMVCIEPITFYPYAVEEKNLHQGFLELNKDTHNFKVHLHPDN